MTGTPQLARRHDAVLTVRDVVARSLVAAVYQPIVDLETGDTVGFEALARGPAGSPLESPTALFDAAREAGVEAELDWACRAAAYRGALDAGLGTGVPLFVNSEPAALGTECPPHLRALVDSGRRRLHVVEELTERAVARSPHALLVAAATARARGWLVAMDDVGVEPSSLALLPLVDPDVVKLDLSLVQNPPGLATARVVHAVAAQVERSGALVLAEGIETVEHLATARVFGARLGQGWYFGRPGRLPRRLRVAPTNPLLALAERTTAVPADPVRTPFEVAAAARPVRRGTKAALLPTSLLLEQRAMHDPEPPILLSCFQDVERFTPKTRERYAALARVSPFVAAIGRGMPLLPVDGVRGADLGTDDPLRGEWNVVVVGPHHAAALLAREVDDPGRPDIGREFEMVLTHDRDLVLAVARSLVRWVAPAAS